MVKLDKADYPPLYDRYRRVENFFPLIGAVLLDEQDGTVFADRREEPRQFYVEHAFGFAQIFGETCPVFEAALERYLLVDKAFAAAKVRLYTPCLPAFLAGPAGESCKSLRQRFSLAVPESPEELLALLDAGSPLTVGGADAGNVSEIERLFGVVGRFWRTPEDFIARANAVVALYQGQPACICYAAAAAERQMEIDVLTLPEFRNLGAGKFAVVHFMKSCFEQSLLPLWDCFANNTGSMQLAGAVGFVVDRPPYPFFTINR